jgi:uncharacterized protein
MLLDTIQAASLAARKAKETEKAALLTTLYAEAARIGKDNGNRLTTDDETLRVVRRFVKGVEDSLAVITQADARERALREKEVLEAFLPQQLTGPALAAAVDHIVRGLDTRTPKQMGLVMKVLREQFAGAYDGNEASALVKAALA